MPKKKSKYHISRHLMMVLLTWGLVVFGGVLILEGVSWKILRSREVVTRYSYQEIYNRAASGLNSWQAEKAGDRTADLCRLHPYFGHVFAHGNNYGFLSPTDYPYQKKPGEFVIGIFGGSTAMHWAEFLQATSRWRKKRLPKGSSGETVILNFAVSGMHQPQQLNVASKFIDGLDLAIVLDGWNDSLVQGCEDPPEMPQDYRLLFQRESDPEMIQSLRALSRRFRDWSAWLDHPLRGQSQLLHLIWLGFENHVRTEYQRVRENAVVKNENSPQFNMECQGPKDEHAFRIWEKYSKQMKALANLYQVPIFHFFQPNPNLPNAKPLDEEEKKIVEWSLHNWQLEGSRGFLNYSFYRHYLKHKMPHSTDLAHLFKDEPRRVYIDPFTHMNTLGYELLTRAVELQLFK